MTKRERRQVYDRTGGRCAYCGCDLPTKGWHLDHIKPLYRGSNPTAGGTDTADNALASCPRCNRWKGVWSVDEFRREIAVQAARLRRDSAAFRLAEDYGLIADTCKPVVFYFETND